MATAVIRLVHPKHYSHQLGRFKSLAFKPSENGGCSVIDLDCARQNSQHECAHIFKYYPARIAGDPVVFFYVETGELPAGCRVIQTDTGTADPCHNEIFGMTEKQCKGMLARQAIEDFRVCDGHTSRSLTVADIENQNPR